MKKAAVNILCSTGITLLLLASVGTLFAARFLFISSVFQCFLTNCIVHAGLLVTHRFESSYAILEYTLDIGYTIAIVVLSGAVFNWYGSTPIWVLILMSVMIYLIGMLLSIIQIRQDVEGINRLLEKRNCMTASKETQK